MDSKAKFCIENLTYVHIQVRISKNNQHYLLKSWHKKLDMQKNTFHPENIPKIDLEKCENERWTQLTRGFASLLTFDWIIDHNFQNTTRNFTFFIPLDSYRKIEEPKVDKKIYFLAKRNSFKKKERWTHLTRGLRVAFDFWLNNWL